MKVLRSSREWALLLVLAAVVYLCFFSQTAALGLVGPDEPRYAQVAREMAESGDWITPRLHGEPWLEKPVLYYWAAAASYKLLGVSEAAARLPSALAATLATLALGWTAWRLYGAAAAWLAMLMFPASIAGVGFGRAASPDMLFAALLAVALAAASEIILRTPAGQRPPRRWQALLGAALGAAVLAKGPAAVVLAGGSVLLWAAVSRRWGLAFRGLHPRVVLWFLLVALPWHVLVALRTPDFLSVFLLGHNLERYLTPAFRHTQPVWFFGPVLLAGLLPWTALLIGPLRDAVRRGKSLRAVRGLFLACWAIFPVLFFSLSQSKLPGYVLPAVGPLLLVAARSVTRGLERREAFAYGLLAAVGLTVAAVTIAVPHWLQRLPAEAGLTLEQAEAWTWLLIGAGAAAALVALARLPWAAVAAVALLVAGLVEAVNRVVVPQLDPYLSPRAAAQQWSPLHGGQAVAVYRLHRAWRYGLNFYFDRELPHWEPGQEGGAWVYTSRDGWEEIAESGREHFVLRYFSRDAVLLHVD